MGLFVARNVFRIKFEAVLPALGYVERVGRQKIDCSVQLVIGCDRTGILGDEKHLG